MDAHKLDVKIQGHSYMHMITVKGHLGNVSLHQMINPYEWFVELIFFLEPGWSTDWIICTESCALANCVKQQCFCLFYCWPLGLESANQKCDWFGTPAIHLSGISNLLSVFKGFFYGGGGLVVSNQSTEITALLMCLYAYSVAKTGNLAIFLTLFKILVSMI